MINHDPLKFLIYYSNLKFSCKNSFFRLSDYENQPSMMKRPSSYLDRSTYRQDETSSREPPQKTNRSAQQRNFSQTTMDQRFV